MGAKTAAKCTLSIRVDLPDKRIGPGKIALLKALDKQHSIQLAAAALQMSYPRALKLLEEMNEDLIAPVTTSRRGGSSRGGTSLTKEGRALIDAYEGLCKSATDATRSERRTITSLFKPRSD